MDNFGSHNGSFFMNKWNIVALYSNVFEKLGKNEMKNWNLHSNLSNQKKKPKKINVEFKVYFTNNGTSNVTIQTTPKKLSLWIFFIVVTYEIRVFFEGAEKEVFSSI